MKTLVSHKTNKFQIFLAIMFFIGGFLLLSLFTSCLPSRETCMRMYPVLMSDTTSTKKDTVREIKYLQTPGKIVHHHDTINMPCKDSTRLWAIFTQQLNDILNRDNKIKQSLIFDNNSLDYTLTVKTDSIKVLKETINILTDRLKKVYQGVPVYINKTSTFDIVLRWIVGILLGGVIIRFIIKNLKFK